MEETDLANPILAVWKVNGDIRMCGDFKGLNANIVDNKFPNSRIEELLDEIGTGNECFSKIDLQAAYHQIPLLEMCQYQTTIMTHMEVHLCIQ